MRVSLCSRENNCLLMTISRDAEKLGNGELTQSEGRINLENLCVLINNIQELVNNVYPDIDSINCKKISWFKEKAILSHTNK